MARRRDRGQVQRNCSKDDLSQPRTFSRTLAYNRAERFDEGNRLNNDTSIANNHGAPRMILKECNSEDSSSSDNEDDSSFHPCSRFGFMRNFSDYETGESSDMTPQSLYSFTNKRGRNLPGGNLASSHSYGDSDSSSDNPISSPKKVKRPLSPTSSSDTSDSGVPITPKRSNKRLRVISSSESSSSEASEVDSNENIENYVTIAERSQSSEYQHLRNLNHENPERVVQSPGSENDSEIDVVSISHTVRGRRNPVIESDDDITLRTEISGVNGANAVRLRIENIIQNLGPGQINRRQSSREENEHIPTMNIAGRDTRYARRRRREVVESNITIPETDRHNTWRVTSQAEESRDNASQLQIRGRIVVGRRTPVIESEEESEMNSINNETTNSEGHVINLRTRNVRRVSPRRSNVRRSEDMSSAINDLLRRRWIMLPSSESDDSTSSSSSSSDSDRSALSTRSNHQPRQREHSDAFGAGFYELHGDPNLNSLSVEGVEVNIKASTAKTVLANRKLTQTDNSSDSDTEADKCPICLASFKAQQVGKPISCEHIFCCKCIKEWAMKNSTCPVDRKNFNKLVVYDKYEGKAICEVPIKNAEPEDDDDDDFDMVGIINIDPIENDIFDDSWFPSDNEGPEEFCLFCGESNHPDEMICCDGCLSVFHLCCVNPPLESFPVTGWYCSHCTFVETDSESSSDSNN